MITDKQIYKGNNSLTKKRTAKDWFDALCETHKDYFPFKQNQDSIIIIKNLLRLEVQDRCNHSMRYGSENSVGIITFVCENCDYVEKLQPPQQKEEIKNE